MAERRRAFLVCLDSVDFKRCSLMEQHHRVVIIGAGIAGLSCGKYLIDNGIDDFVILEAYGRIGGRCQTIEFCGYSRLTSRPSVTDASVVHSANHAIELGTETLDGEISNNPLYRLADEHHLIDRDDST